MLQLQVFDPNGNTITNEAITDDSRYQALNLTFDPQRLEVETRMQHAVRESPERRAVVLTQVL